MLKVSYTEGHKYLELDFGSEGSKLLDMSEQRELYEFLMLQGLIDPTFGLSILGGEEYLRDQARDYRRTAQAMWRTHLSERFLNWTKRRVKGG